MVSIQLSSLSQIKAQAKRRQTAMGQRQTRCDAGSVPYCTMSLWLSAVHLCKSLTEIGRHLSIAPAQGSGRSACSLNGVIVV